MTGVEAVSNGGPAVQAAEAKNAAATMTDHGRCRPSQCRGITLLAATFTNVTPSEQETVVSQMARGVFGAPGRALLLRAGATMLILVLAANTAYADFPRLALHPRARRLPATAVA